MFSIVPLIKIIKSNLLQGVGAEIEKNHAGQVETAPG